MATFVMVHGAWHGGWCFDPLRAPLEAAGHVMVTPDLPGMGGTATELAAVTLAGWGNFVADICRSATRPVVLVGHSRGGLVISQAAETAHEAMGALVYVCAMLMPSGLTRAEWKKQAEPNPAFEAIIQPHPSGHATTIDRGAAPAVFAQLSPIADALAAAARLVAEPLAPRLQPLTLTDARYDRVPRHYVECLHDRVIPIADQRAMQAALPCASVTTLDADHSPFLSAPDALADALLTIAEGFAP